MGSVGATEVMVVFLLVIVPAAVIFAVVRLGARGSGRSGQSPVVGAPGWHPDPTGRHEFRYWDGRGWSDRISDRGNEALDPLDVVEAAPRQVL